MAYRTSCSALVGRLRDLIGDPAGPACGTPTWSNDQLQTALDNHRSDVRYLELVGAETIQPGGAVVYLDYYASRGDWESGVALTDSQGYPITPETSDLQTGHWTFAADTLPPAYLTGQSFDLYGAAVEILQKWLAKVKLDFTFSPGSGQYVRSQKFQMISQLIEQYQAMRAPTLLLMERGDQAC
jgi:hypothetical protein